MWIICGPVAINMSLAASVKRLHTERRILITMIDSSRYFLPDEYYESVIAFISRRSEGVLRLEYKGDSYE